MKINRVDEIFELLFEKAPLLFIFIVFVIIVAIALVIDDAFVSWFFS